MTTARPAETCFTFNRRRGLLQALIRLDDLAQGTDFLLAITSSTLTYRCKNG